MTTPGLIAWKLAFELSPIVLVNGVVEGFPQGILPIVAITEAVNFPLGLLSGGENIDLNNFFAQFRPLPGSTLVDQEVGHYPFATQAIAANATIAQPLQIAMEMIVPARGTLGWPAKLAIMSALQAVIRNHNRSGGTYIVATPSKIYTNCLLRSLRDVSDGRTGQSQSVWQWDFEQPLITLDDAASAQNGLMSWMTRETQISNPVWSGTTPAVGQPIAVGTSGITSAVGPSSGTIAAGSTS